MPEEQPNCEGVGCSAKALYDTWEAKSDKPISLCQLCLTRYTVRGLLKSTQGGSVLFVRRESCPQKT